MLVQRPQFDVAALTVGRAVHIRDTSHLVSSFRSAALPRESGLKDIDANAIVTKVQPLQVTVSYFSAKEDRMEYVVIPVDLVAEKRVTIKMTEVVEDGKNG